METFHAINASLTEAFFGVSPVLSDNEWTWHFPADGDVPEHTVVGVPPDFANDYNHLFAIIGGLTARDDLHLKLYSKSVGSPKGNNYHAQATLGRIDKDNGCQLTDLARCEASPPSMALAMLLLTYAGADFHAMRRRLYPKVATAGSSRH